MDPWFYKFFARPIIKAYVHIVYNPTIIGKDNIPKNGRCILAGNHTNNFDCILLISCTKRCIHFLAKDELYKGFKKILFKNMGIIPVNRRIKDKSVIRKADAILEKEGLIGVFPEGTINRTEDVIMPFKMGTVKMASDTDSYIVPFCITGEYKPFKKNNLQIVFDKPYKLKDKNLEFENQKLMNIVSKNITRYKEK